MYLGLTMVFVNNKLLGFTALEKIPNEKKEGILKPKVNMWIIFTPIIYNIICTPMPICIHWS